MMVAPSSFEAWIQQHTIGVPLTLLHHIAVAAMLCSVWGNHTQTKDVVAPCSMPTCSPFATMHSFVYLMALAV